MFRQTKKFQYSPKQYKNPFFQKKGKALDWEGFDYDFGFKIKIYLATGLFIIITFLGFLFYANYFKIKSINVSGQGIVDPKKIETLARQQMESGRLIFWPTDNIFIFNKSKLLDTLRNKYSFSEIEIEKKIPNTININYLEKKYALIWQEEDKYYYASINGDIIAEANVLEIKQKDYPLIKNLSDKKILNNHIQPEAIYLDAANKLWEKFKSLTDFQIDYFIIDNEVNTIKVTLTNNPTIYFNIAGDLDKQISKLVIIKAEKLRVDFDKKQYIDVRIGDTVYYR